MEYHKALSWCINSRCALLSSGALHSVLVPKYKQEQVQGWGTRRVKEQPSCHVSSKVMRQLWRGICWGLLGTQSLAFRKGSHSTPGLLLRERIAPVLWCFDLPLFCRQLLVPLPAGAASAWLLENWAHSSRLHCLGLPEDFLRVLVTSFAVRLFSLRWAGLQGFSFNASSHLQGYGCYPYGLSALWTCKSGIWLGPVQLGKEAALRITNSIVVAQKEIDCKSFLCAHCLGMLVVHVTLLKHFDAVLHPKLRFLKS